MRKFSWIAFVILAGTLAVAGCKKAKVDVEEEVTIEEKETDGAQADKIVAALSTPLCKRMIECAPGAMTEEECVKELGVSLGQALQEKEVDVSDKELNACVDDIKKSSCEEIMGTEPPENCKFLQ